MLRQFGFCASCQVTKLQVQLSVDDIPIKVGHASCRFRSIRATFHSDVADNRSNSEMVAVLDERQLKRRLRAPPAAADRGGRIALCPCVAVHTEETQLQRFSDRLVASFRRVAVVAIASPLVYAQSQPEELDSVPTEARGREATSDEPSANAVLRKRIEAEFGTGRIHAHRVYQLDWSCADPEWIPMAAPMLALKKRSIFRVVAFPKPLQDKMTALLHAHGYTTHPKQYTNELHVTVQSSISPYFHFGVVTRESASSATTGTDAASSTSTSVAADAPCRAYFKMEESLRYVKLQPGDRVIDVGASPVRGVFVVGGWTECLVHNGAHVVAVDPGELTIDTTHKPIVHLQMLLEDATSQLEQLGPFAMCVCDINIRVHLMSELMLSISHLLLPSAHVVFTLKLGKKPTDLVIQEAFDDAVAILSPSFRGFQMIWLHANTQNERTLFAIKK